MTIKLEKETELDGTVWFKIWKGNACLKCFQEDTKLSDAASDAEINAVGYYNQLLENHKNGLPKKEIILSENIEL